MAETVAELPPGPKSPAVWQLLHYSQSPLPFLEACARRYGDPFTIKLAGYGQFVMLASPDAVQDVFRGDRRLHDLDEAMVACIEKRREETVAERGETILTDLLAASHADGTPLSNQEIRDALVTLIFAGHDTMSVALSWALEQIVPRTMMAQWRDQNGAITVARCRQASISTGAAVAEGSAC